MSWFKGFGKKKSRADEPDFSAEPITLGDFLVTDVHSHLVPQVDDGSESMEQSLEMIQRLVLMGYQKAVLTPHIHSDIYPNSERSLRPAFEKLQATCREHWPNFQLHLAAEYFLDSHFGDCIAARDLLWFPAQDDEGRPVKCVLFEFGFHAPPMNHEELIFELQMGGYTGVLAHAERYPYWHRHPDEIEKLHERGIWITVNAASLAGAYGPEMYAVARRLVQSRIAKMICSDAHGPRHMDSLLAISKSPLVQDWARHAAPASARVLPG